MVSRSYVPDRGHVVWITFDAGRGHEQSGRRPAFVFSPKFYNVRSGLALVCPITSQAKWYPFEVAVSAGKVVGVVLVDQLRSIDWVERQVHYAGRVRTHVLREVQEKLRRLIE